MLLTGWCLAFCNGIVRTWPVILVLLFISFSYAFWCSSNTERKVSSSLVCTKDPFSAHKGFVSKYPSIYSIMLLGCKLKRTNEEDRRALSLFYATGTGHLLSISGLHIGGIALIVYILINSILYIWVWHKKKLYVPFFRISLVISLAASIVYVALIGVEIPRLRSILMLLLSASAPIFILFRNKFIVLGVSACAVLFVFPDAVSSYSFYYTFIAVLAIFLSPSKKTLNVCILIFAFMLPLNLKLSGVIDLTNIISNLVVIPIFTFIYFPLELMLFGLFSLGYYSVLSLMDVLTLWLLRVLSIFDFLGKYIGVRTSKIDLVETIVLYSVLTLLFLGIFYLRNKISKRHIICFYSAFFVLGLFSTVYFYIKYFNVGDLISVYEIDKPRKFNGSGDLIHIRTGGHNLLVDTGYGDRSVKKALDVIRTKKVSIIDYLIITHTDVDHIKGLETVLGQSDIKIKNIITSPCVYLKKKDLFVRNSVMEACKDSVLFLDAERSLSFLNPVCNEREQCGNPSALTFILHSRGKNVVFSSDTPTRSLKLMNDISKIDVSNTLFQFPHHCSAKEKPFELLGNKRPIIAFCTRHKELLKSGVTPAEYDFPVFMTGRCGDITIELKRESVKVSSQRCSKLSLQTNKS